MGIGTVGNIRRLPCDNIHDFIDGRKTFYTVNGRRGLQIGDKVELYHNTYTYTFNVGYIHRIRGNDVLALVTWE